MSLIYTALMSADLELEYCMTPCHCQYIVSGGGGECALIYLFRFFFTNPLMCIESHFDLK